MFIKQKPSLVASFQTSEIISLLIAAVSTDKISKLSKVEVVQVIGLISFEKEDLTTFLKNYTFNFSNVSGIFLSAALNVFRTRDLQILSKIFDENSTSYFNRGVLLSIQSLPFDELNKFIAEFNVLNQIITLFEKKSSNGYIYELGSYLGTNSSKIQGDHAKFSSFYEKSLKPFLKTRDSVYAGSKPVTDAPQDDSDDGEFIQTSNTGGTTIESSSSDEDDDFKYASKDKNQFSPSDSDSDQDTLTADEVLPKPKTIPPPPEALD